ncbi:hypothetical protein [Nocardia sp. alder85J]|uniref:hypothetical protein n=1 Tax=Nocardia sp. alder85J TaxID=2862949 RepID=UPI001CD3A806|nr:hypothetical protein [Nocardia sp. alder85J]MCX4094539.1 hypothetical protein [Nocardia sp. alder85J]
MGIRMCPATPYEIDVYYRPGSGDLEFVQNYGVRLVLPAVAPVDDLAGVVDLVADLGRRQTTEFVWSAQDHDYAASVIRHAAADPDLPRILHRATDVDIDAYRHFYTE